MLAASGGGNGGKGMYLCCWRDEIFSPLVGEFSDTTSCSRGGKKTRSGSHRRRPKSRDVFFFFFLRRLRCFLMSTMVAVLPSQIQHRALLPAHGYLHTDASTRDAGADVADARTDQEWSLVVEPGRTAGEGNKATPDPRVAREHCCCCQVAPYTHLAALRENFCGAVSFFPRTAMNVCCTSVPMKRSRERGSPMKSLADDTNEKSRR